MNSKEYNLKNLLEPCVSIAKLAGEKILEFYKSKLELSITLKKDSTPVTKADLTAHMLIAKHLNQLTSDIPILSEEAANIPFKERKKWDIYWLIDPLDGTKEFINQTDEFTVNIALIKGGKAILGVIYAPVFKECYFAAEHQGAYKQNKNEAPKRIHTRKVDSTHLKAMVSRRHNVDKAIKFLELIPNHVKIAKGSSLKSCLVAEGLADVYPCFGKTSEWDMGAAQCVVEEAGGIMFDLDANPILFNQKESLLNPPLLVVGDKDYNWKQLISKYH